MATQTPVAGAVGGVVAVASTDTLVVSPFSVVLEERVGCTLANDDATQTLNAWVEVGPTADGPWYRSPWSGFEVILPTTSRTDVFGTVGYQFARLVGTQSGAGGNVRVWAWKVRE